MIELVEAKINRECVLAGKPPPYDLSNPTDADIADHAADSIRERMRYWGSKTRSDGSKTAAYVNARNRVEKAQRKAE